MCDDPVVIRWAQFRVADMLPDVSVSRATGTPVSLRSEVTQTTMLVWTHPDECPECRRFVLKASALADEFVVWDARLVVVTSAVREAGVLVADRYGQIFYATQAGEEHAFPEAREMTEWLKHLGTLCPE